MSQVKRIPVAAGNWKLHKTIGETTVFCEALKKGLSSEMSNGLEVVIAPTALSLASAANITKGSAVKIAAQNSYSESKGAFTGEISPTLIKDAGCSHVILGHSERRHVFGETDAMINSKVKAVMAEGLIPIFCVGETLEEREAGQVEGVLKRQITEGLKDISFKSSEEIIIAYEPVWAIGTGKTAGPEDAQSAHSYIRGLLTADFKALSNSRILYGGSVKPDNAAALTAEVDVDGVLVGGASLEPESFLEIIKNTSK